MGKHDAAAAEWCEKSAGGKLTKQKQTALTVAPVVTEKAAVADAVGKK